MPLQWRNQMWQSLEEGAGKRCSDCGAEEESARPSSLKGTSSNQTSIIVQELCESRGGRPGLSVLTSLLVSVEVKNY